MKFFNDKFSHHFTWKGQIPFLVATLNPKDKKQLSEGLKLMSSESIRNRFLGSKKEFTSSELNYLTDLDGDNHFAIGLAEASRYKRGIGVVRLARSEIDPEMAEVAVTLIDEYQKLGLGMLLMDLIILAAHEKGYKKLSFTYLPQNGGIVRLLNKYGSPLKGRSNIDFEEVFFELRQVNLKEISKRLQEIGLFKE